MLDFGEYTQFDVSLYSKEDPYSFHNKFPLEWAKVNREAISEASKLNDIVAFMRAGSSMSPAFTDMYWMGDQLPTFDQWDGMESALVGILNGGLSGYTFGHSDIGGYTTFTSPVGAFYRDKETLLRWIEMNTFSDLMMRTHPSNIPNSNWQVYSDEETAQFFAYFGKVHV